MKTDNINVLALAYLGDSVYDLYIREYLISKNIVNVNELQSESIKYVSAKSQSYYLDKIKDHLTEKELDIVKRGRNHKSHKAPKNTDISTYKNATGLETLIGYLYLEDKVRLDEIMKLIERDD